LQIGEVGQRFSAKKFEDVEHVPGLDSSQGAEQVENEAEGAGSSRRESKELKEGEEGWSITFEQFYASILTEPSLVDNFSERFDVENLLKEYSSFGRPRVSSVETKDNSRSVFYV